MHTNAFQTLCQQTYQIQYRVRLLCFYYRNKLKVTEILKGSFYKLNKQKLMTSYFPYQYSTVSLIPYCQPFPY